MKHILWVVAIAFIGTIIFSWGMGGFKNKGSEAERGIIGIINSQKIYYKNFSMVFDQELKNTKEKSPNIELTDYQISNIRDRTWQNITNEILMAQEIKRLKMKISDDEIFFFMRNSPPDFVRSVETFQTDGEFDMSKYQEALNDPSNYHRWAFLENYFRNNLPLQKLQQWILSTTRTTDSEIEQNYRLENEKLNVKYIFFEPKNESLENITISESEIKSYYKEHKKDYLEQEKRKIKYVIFELKPSYDDSLQTQADIQYIQEQIADGSDFTQLAIDYSEDVGTAPKGGDLGFIEKGSMVKPFEDAVFSAKTGKIVGPVHTRYGIHLIKVEERKKERGKLKVHARHILLKYKPSPETRDMIHDKAQYLSDEAKRMDDITQFEDLVNQEGLILKESTFFQKGQFIPGLGIAARINHFTFNENINWISTPMYASEKIVVFTISEIQEEHIRPLEDVKSQIEHIIENQKLKEQAAKHCQIVRESIQDEMDFEKVAQSDSLQIEETGFFSLRSGPPRIGKDSKFIGMALKLEINQTSQPFEGERGYYLIKLIDKIEFDKNIFTSEKKTLIDKYLQEKKESVYMSWYNHLKRAAEIDDFRNQFF
jgi:parvulin-like peptidyl-prolyl isomerase